MTGSQLNMSYFCGYDYRFGWGNFTYFTFFSQFNRPWAGTAYIEASLMIVLFLVSAVGNAFIIGFVIKSKNSRNITNYLVCNLAIADLLFAASAPFVAYIRFGPKWRLGHAMCSILIYGMFVCSIVLIWTMAVISIDRYICTNLNLSATKRMRPRHVLITAITIWILSGVLYLPVAIFFHVEEIDTHKGTISFCTVVWPKTYSDLPVSLIFTCAVVTINFAIPLIIIIVNYFRIFKRFWLSRRTVANAPGIIARDRRSFVSRSRRNMRIVKTLTLLVLVFLMMWLPLFVTFSLIQYDVTNAKNSIPSHVLVWTLMFAYCNSCVNPFLYGFINQELQRGILACCRRHHVEDILVSQTRNDEQQNRETSNHSHSVHI